MIRYVKYIFLVFGGLALAIVLFFLAQNKEDLKLVWEYRPHFSYEEVKNGCSEAYDEYYYPCFIETFDEYVQQVGLTGISFGLKMAFSFMDDDKAKSNIYSQSSEQEKLKDVTYAINYLELNNLAIRQSYKKFLGFQVMYAGYVSSVRDFLEGAKEFSDNLIMGLEAQGLASLENTEVKKQLWQRFDEVKQDYKNEYNKANTFIQSEIDRLLDAHDQG